jgi:hypothetical protein
VIRLINLVSTRQSNSHAYFDPRKEDCGQQNAGSFVIVDAHIKQRSKNMCWERDKEFSYKMQCPTELLEIEGYHKMEQCSTRPLLVRYEIFQTAQNNFIVAFCSTLLVQIRQSEKKVRSYYNDVSVSRAVVPNGGGTAPRWALKRSKGTFLVQGKFRGR